MSNAPKEPKELLKYRLKLFRDAQDFKTPDRVPLSGNATHWMFLDAGYDTQYAVRHYDVIEKCMERFITEYPMDQINMWMSGFRNFDAVTDILGDSGYEGSDGNLINFVAEDIVGPDEYDFLIEDLTKATWERFLSRKYPAMKDMAPQQFAESVKEYFHYRQERDRIENRLQNEYGLIFERDRISGWTSLESLFNGMRGIKGLSMDLRRRYDKVKAYCETNDVAVKEWVGYQISELPGRFEYEPYDVFLSMLPHTILKPKQFEELMWNTALKPIYDLAVEKGLQVANFSEGSWMHVADFFSDYPKGTVMNLVESDDPYEIRKKLPNVCIYGGLDQAVLAHGSPEECVDMAKRAVDELGRDGGLILAPGKMLAFPGDCRSENLKAVCEYVNAQ